MMMMTTVANDIHDKKKMKF